MLEVLLDKVDWWV